MKRTCLQKNTYTDEQNTCEFHSDEILLKERSFDPKAIQQVKSFVRMKRAIILIIALLPTIGFCQYIPQFSQLINTLEFVNPGYNASKDLSTAVLLYRNQWTGFEGAPKTYAFNANIPVNKWHSGFGINTIAETRGLTTQINTDLTACVDVKASNSAYLTFGLSGGVESKRLDLERAVYFGDIPYSAQDFNSDNVHVGMGLNLFTQKIHLGASMHYSQLNGNQNFDNEYYAFYLNGSYLISLNEIWTLKPALLYRQFGGYNNFESGTFILYKDVVWIGISHRFKQALIFFADVKVTNFMRIGYSYDFGISSVSNFNNESHEIRIELTVPRKTKTFDRMAYNN